jgi:serine/threonine-protein kinase
LTSVLHDENLKSGLSMLSMPPEDLLPVLVAELAEDAAYEVLLAAAANGSELYVPLDVPPISASKHVLEVHLPSMAEPVYFLALPVGPPTEDGFPMAISPMPDAVQRLTKSDAPPLGASVRSRNVPVPLPLTESHAADLKQPEPPKKGADDPLVGRSLAGGKLLIEKLIGRGGVGAVYKATHRELRMPVAVKVLHESFQHDIDFCRRFYSEALAASRLDHPNLTRVVDFGQEPDGLLYLAMEFLAGVELRSVIEKEKRLSAQRIAEIMMQTCAGLSHAHARGIVHRDIKPENLVMVPGQDDDGQTIELVKVCDFGIAQGNALPGAKDSGNNTAGTPAYMSPEQCRGDDLDARSDVYSCGIVLYELATGELPFKAERPQSLLNKQQFTPPAPPSSICSEVDPRLEQIILKALEKEPEDRPQSMRALRAELRDLLQSITGETSSATGTDKATGTALVPGDRHATSSSGQFATERNNRESPEPPPAKRAAAVPDWLERGPTYANAYETASTTTQAAAPSPSPPSSYALGAALAHGPAETPAPKVDTDEIADAIVQNAPAWLRRFADTTDPKAFAILTQRLAPSLRTLAKAGEMRALWSVASTLNGIATESTHAKGSRAQAASELLRVFDDPSMLSLVAEHLFIGSEEARTHARRMLVQAGVAGAYGLYGARVKLANNPSIRNLFSSVLVDFGPKAWPVVRAALEKIIATDQSKNVRTMELAEDMLRAVPNVGDESAGHLVVKYLRVNVSGVCRAATGAIVKLWSQRAKPLLVGMLQSKDDVVRIASVAGLRQLGAIDEQIVPRLQAILLRRIDAGEELRAAAAIALASVSPSARQPAISLLIQLMNPAHDPPPAPRGSGLSREDAVALAIARALLTLGGRTYRPLVSERAERSGEALRDQMKKLLAG